jgi:HPt (histidine-containing phosphotransfer) domain-containing protein
VRPTPQPTSPSPLQSTDGSAPELDEESPIINTSELMHRVGGDLQLIEILTDAYREDAPQHVSAFRSAVEAGDLSAAKRVAHTIKGSAGNLAGVRLSTLAEELEQAAAVGQLEVAQAGTARLEQEVNALLDELEVLSKSAVSLF